MDFKATVDIIIRDIDNMTDIIDDFKNYPGVPVIQVELAKSKCRSTIEILTLIKNMNIAGIASSCEELSKPLSAGAAVVHDERSSPGRTTIADDGTATREADHAEIKAEEKTNQRFTPNGGVEIHDTADPVVTEPVEPALVTHTVKDAETKDINGFDNDDSHNSTSGKEVKAPAKNDRQPSILAETFSVGNSSINDVMRSKGSYVGHSVKNGSPSALNLSDIIGINDKFLFVREIFDGDSGLYKDVISRIDNTTSLDEAEAVVKEYHNEKTAEACQMLLNFIRKKFNADR